MQRISMILLILVGGWWFWPEESTDWPIKNVPTSLNKAIFFGDSLTFGKGSSEGMNYPSQLSKMTQIELVNKGRNGDTTSSALARLGDVTEVQADAVFITLVGNDIMKQHGLQTASQNLSKIFQKLSSHGFLVVYLNIDPPIVSSKWRDTLLKVAKENGVLWVDRVMDGLWLDSSKMHDQIHPNDAGYKVMADRVLKTLRDKNINL